MTDYEKWEDWPGYNEETRVELERLASSLCDDLQSWSGVIDDRGFVVDRILIKGVSTEHHHEHPYWRQPTF